MYLQTERESSVFMTNELRLVNLPPFEGLISFRGVSGKKKRRTYPALSLVSSISDLRKVLREKKKCLYVCLCVFMCVCVCVYQSLTHEVVVVGLFVSIEAMKKGEKAQRVERSLQCSTLLYPRDDVL